MSGVGKVLVKDTWCGRQMTTVYRSYTSEE